MSQFPFGLPGQLIQPNGVRIDIKHLGDEELVTSIKELDSVLKRAKSAKRMHRKYPGIVAVPAPKNENMGPASDKLEELRAEWRRRALARKNDELSNPN